MLLRKNFNILGVVIALTSSATLAESPKAKKELVDTYNTIRAINYNITTSQTVLLAHKVGLFDFIGQSSVAVDKIQARFKTLKARAVNAMISVCLNQKLLEKNNDGTIKLSSAARNSLLEKSAYNMRSVLDFWIQNDINLKRMEKEFHKKSIKDQKNIVEFKDFSLEQRCGFIEKMHGKSFIPAEFLGDYMDLSSVNTLVDIGGGSGIFAVNIKKEWPQIKCSIYEQPCVSEISKDWIKKAGYENDIDIISGDMFKDPLPSADIHFYSEVFHDWSPKQCQILAKRSFKALPKGGKIVLFEMIFNDDKSGPFNTVGQDVTMQLFTEGQQFSKKELSKILEDAGFVDVSFQKTHTDYSVVIAIKP